jgi:hypothetical protein
MDRAHTKVTCIIIDPTYQSWTFTSLLVSMGTPAQFWKTKNASPLTAKHSSDQISLQTLFACSVETRLARKTAKHAAQLSEVAAAMESMYASICEQADT